MEDPKKYTGMENVLQCINSNFISLNDEKIKTNNMILRHMLDGITTRMKETSKLFEKLYREIFFGGSYYDGLKISDPQEYDCDMLLDIPKYSGPKIQMSDSPGFVQVQLTDFEKFKKQPEFFAYYSELTKLLDDDNYLSVDKIKRWMESLLSRTLNKLEKKNKYYLLEVDQKIYYLLPCKHGPAFTIKITDSIENGKITMDVDLVPCFIFQDWPSEPFRKNSSNINTFFVVPKKPTTDDINQSARYWRLSFQQQEQEIIGDRRCLKPALKLLKKLRDNLNHVSISSYFLKTIFIWEAELLDDMFRRQNLSTVFMVMLKIYLRHLEAGSIPYYWDLRYNLIQNIKESEKENIKNKIKNIISDIDRNLIDPTIIAKYLLTRDELPILKGKVNLSKRIKRNVDSVDGLLPIIQANVTLSSIVPTTTVHSSSTNNFNVDSTNKDALTSIRNIIDELNDKIDSIVTDQKTIKKMLETLSNKNDNLETKLNELKESSIKERQRVDDIGDRLYLSAREVRCAADAEGLF